MDLTCNIQAPKVAIINIYVPNVDNIGFFDQVSGQSAILVNNVGSNLSLVIDQLYRQINTKYFQHLAVKK